MLQLLRVISHSAALRLNSHRTCYWRAGYLLQMVELPFNTVSCSKPLSTNTRSPSTINNDLTLDYWADRWTNKTTGFHEHAGNQLLLRNFSELLAGQFSESEVTKSRTDMKIFVPLCGKAVDMYFFYKLGFSVVGVEFCPQPIKDFFRENCVRVNRHGTAGPFTVSEDRKLVIGQGDLYFFGPGGISLSFPKYDIIWDRGSFEAINENEKEVYSKFVVDFLADDGMYLMSVHNYSKAEYSGPPSATMEADLLHFYGHLLTVQHVASRNCLTDGSDREMKLWASRNVSSVVEDLYIMRWKK